MPCRFITISILIIVILCVSFITLPCLATEKQEARSFAAACKALKRVSHDTGSTRDEWLRVIDSFEAIHKAKSDSKQGSLCLLLTGKAYIDLYRRCGKLEDLNDAISHLNNFTKVNRDGPYLIPGLQALKEADLLRREVESRENKSISPWARPSAEGHQSQHAQEKQIEIKEQAGAELTRRTLDSTPTDHAEGKSEIAGRLLTYNCTGNPFYTKSKSHATGPANQVQTASIPSHTATDGLPQKSSKSVTSQEFVIVIDPGHGGKDPGAVSSDGSLKEKDLTLEIAKDVKDKLEKGLPGSTIALTRSADTFLALEERTVLANSMNADLFLSIHCNADVDPGSKGVETYFLSKADSRKAMRAAARENDIPLAAINDLQGALLDLMITSRMKESVKLAADVHGHVMQNLAKPAFGARDRGIKAAPLYVLLGAKMPAIMVECGFMSNKSEKKRLSDPEYRDSIARGLAEGAIAYLKSVSEKGVKSPKQLALQ